MGQLAKNNGHPLAGEAREKAHNVMDQTKDMLQQQIATRTEGAAGELVDAANALRQTSKQLDGNSVAPLVAKAADHLERASSYVRTADLNEIQRSMTRFARRQPLLFLGGAFALGMAAARFLKATSTTTEKEP